MQGGLEQLAAGSSSRNWCAVAERGWCTVAGAVHLSQEVTKNVRDTPSIAAGTATVTS